MNFEKFNDIVKSSKYQLLVITEKGQYFTKIPHVSYNEIGVVCTFEKDGTIEVILYEDILFVISDGKKYK